MREYVIRKFDSGLITEFDDTSSIPENSASSSLNWLTFSDHIELSGFYNVVGTELSGLGETTGLHIGQKVNGDKQPFYTHGKKIKYYDTTTDDWIEIGTDTLGASADGEDISFTEYISIAGYQTWLSSPNSSLYKIMNANPDSIKDMYDASYNFKGYITSANNRLLLWFRDKFKNVLYGSYKDVQNTTTYTTVSNEVVGASGSTNYTGTLTQVTGTRTCFNVVITDGYQTAQDNKNGAFTGNATGTINYTTGEYDITFGAPTVDAVTSTYEYENSTTGKGLANFTFTSTRIATEGFILHQSTGGDILNILPYKSGDIIDYYCLHNYSSWLYTMPSNDLLPVNNIYREKIGMKNWRAAVSTGNGIYYIDTSDPIKPKFKLLTLGTQNAKVEPIIISYNLNLSGYNFDNAVGYEWGDYILFACATDTVNNRLFVFNKQNKTFDVLKYFVSCLADNNGVLWAGDSSTNNVQRLFTGTSANNSVQENYWIGKLTQLEIDEIKRFRKLTLKGKIDKSQSAKVYLAYDGGNFNEIGEIDGNGSYVSQLPSNTVGTTEVGQSEVGGGSISNQHYSYVREFNINTPKFDEIKIKIVAQGSGYFSFNYLNYFDITVYGQRNLSKYTNN